MTSEYSCNNFEDILSRPVALEVEIMVIYDAHKEKHIVSLLILAVQTVPHCLCSLLAATSQFSVFIG